MHAAHRVVSLCHAMDRSHAMIVDRLPDWTGVLSCDVPAEDEDEDEDNNDIHSGDAALERRFMMTCACARA